MHLLKWTIPDDPGEDIEIELEKNTQERNYAILSHRWGKPEDEVTFEDMRSGSDLLKEKDGYRKLEYCCRQAHQDGHRYVWIDTCCIDKSSSAELSEAITSMYSYYEQSQVCYVFLDDIERDSATTTGDEYFRGHLPRISQSLWFTRGWTLQELIAPPKVKFFDSFWQFIGYKTDNQMSRQIQDATGIHPSILRHPTAAKAVSISGRMSWAARRTTTRIEDASYSLMGLFGVYMPPLYGEGHHAFIRLQEEIMRISNDHTLFAWTRPPPPEISQHHTFERLSTMLALSPKQFDESSGFKPRPYDRSSNTQVANGAGLDYTTTNAGLSINLPIVQVNEENHLYAAILRCTEGESKTPSAILLHTTAKTPQSYFWRANTTVGAIERSGNLWFQAEGRDDLKVETVYILPKLTSVSQDYIEPPWGPLEYPEPEVAASAGPPLDESSIVSTTPFNTRRTLVQAEDPFSRDLQSLRKARHMTYGPASQLYKESLGRQRMFPKGPRWNKNRHFIGRSAQLQEIKNLLEVPNGETANPDLLLISGMVGTGKSQLAREFCYHCLKEELFNPVIWIRSVTDSHILGDFYKVAEEMGLMTAEADPSNAISMVLQWLNGLDTFLSYPTRGSFAGQYLIVFDNVRDAHSLDPFLREFSLQGAGRILATSQSSLLGWNLDVRTIVLGPLDDSEAHMLLQSELGETSDLTQIVSKIGGLPLALRTVAQYLNASGLSVDKFLEKFEKHEEHQKPDDHKKELDRNQHIGTDLGPTLSESLELSFQMLEPSSLALLSTMSFFDPDFIHDGILVSSKSLPLDYYPRTPEDFHRSLESLMRMSLIARSVQGRGLSMHRVIQKEIQDRMDTDSYNKAFATAITLIHSAWIDRRSDSNGREWIFKNILPHLLRLEELADKVPDSEDNFSSKENLARLLRYKNE